MEPFPELPLELVFLIIETLLEIAPKRTLDLASLSRQIQPIVERAIYRCVVINERQQAGLFSRMIRSGHRPASFYQNHVRTLCIIYPLRIHELLAILSACSSVQTLGMFHWEDEEKSMEELDVSLDALASSGPRPSKLSCDVRWTLHPEGHLEPHRFNLPFFQNVTHLELYSYENFPDFEGEYLHALTNLTHISLAMMIPGIPSVSELFSKLALTDNILVCIIHPRSYNSVTVFEAIDLCSKEPRVVFAFTPPDSGDLESQPEHILWREILDDGHFLKQWGRQAEGEMDMWEEAGSIVAAQRALQAAR
ncbi:hypothetical protein C8J56DRAFT_143883 [Mycena floridula]|nr:hypothetical protein C8J56DRAFT_143883 [Mycena floridula]